MARILVVDDNADHRELVGVPLRKGGHHVVDAGNGEIAIASVKTSPRFDVAIVDMYMPVKDGLETIRELRRESTPPRIIAVSAGARALGRRILGSPTEFEVLDDAKVAGADETVAKPFDRKTIIRLVEELTARGSPSAPN